MALSSSTPRSAEASRLPRPALALLVGALMMLAGCITLDGTLKADGSGTLNVSYKLPSNSNEMVEKRRFTSSDVKIESFGVKEGMIEGKLSFTDPVKLSSLQMFRNAKITRQRDGKEERLTITITNEHPKESKDDGKPGPRIGITFPGKVVEANRKATVDGNRATWNVTLVDYFKEKTIELTARYEIPADQPSGDTPSKETEAGKESPKK